MNEHCIFFKTDNKHYQFFCLCHFELIHGFILFKKSML